MRAARFLVAGLSGWLMAAAPGAAQTLGDGVQEALAAEGTVRVLIALEPPPAGTAAAEQASLAVMQDDVLGVLPYGAFEVAHRYQRLAALAGVVTSDGLERLLADPHVVRIDLDAPGSGELAISVPTIRADVLHDVYGLSGAGVSVAVLDSGIDSDHPDLVGVLDGEQCFCSGGGGCCRGGVPARSGPGSAEDDHFHGTHVSGILAGNGTQASVGVAPGTRIVAIKVLDRNNRFCCSSDVVAGLDWILANRPDVRVVNMSLGTSAEFQGECDTATAFTMAFAEAVDALTAAGVAVFAASGNGGSTTRLKAPACVRNAIAVGAVGRSLDVAAFSNAGPGLDLVAPGVGIGAAGRGGGVRFLSGTSMATPHAAGTAALLLEAQPRLSPARLRDALTQTGRPATDPRDGRVHPLVDAEAALLSLEVCDDGIDNDGDARVDVDDPDCPPVAIDIQPHGLWNFLPLYRPAFLTVAVLGFGELDGAEVDPASVAFGPAEAAPRHDLEDPRIRKWHLRDVNGDGVADLLTHYLASDTGIGPDATEACLRGVLAGEAFRACDAVTPLCRHESRRWWGAFRIVRPCRSAWWR